MKKGRFLWSAYRITEKQKAGKAQNIKEKQLQNSRNTVSRQLVARLSSARDNLLRFRISNCTENPQKQLFLGIFSAQKSLVIFDGQRDNIQRIHEQYTNFRGFFQSLGAVLQWFYGCTHGL